MNRIECPGLDGSNPLHFLASLGVLRLLSRGTGETRMGWDRVGSANCPVYARPVERWSIEEMSCELHGWVRELGRTRQPDRTLQRRIRQLAADLNGQEKKLKQEGKAFRASRRGQRAAEIRAAHNEAFGARTAELVRQKTDLAKLQLDAGDSLGDGVAHLGDVIAVTPDLFRLKAEKALRNLLGDQAGREPRTDDAELIVAQMAGLGCDQIAEQGRLAYTPYSFSNGGSGQCLLKDFRECAVTTGPEHVLGALTGQPCYAKTVGSLGWDPADQALHATQWEAPEKASKRGRKRVDPALQALAYMGLSLLPAVPRDGLSAVGWFRDLAGRGIRWPLWDGVLTLDAAMAVVAMDLEDTDTSSVGIRAVFECRVQNPNGKRNFFSPSRSV